MWVTPHALHFGWMHHKQPFYDLSDRLWDLALKNELAGGDGEQEDVSLSLTSDS